MDNIVAKDPFALETGPDQETTIDLALSTTEMEEKSGKEDEEEEDDPDSALGAEGNSESHPISGAPAMLPIFPPLSINSSFQPVQMNLSETKSSSQWSKSGMTEDLPIEQEDAKEAKKHEINVDAKVAEFLDKMRNDERFQISLGSEMLEKRKELPLPMTNETKVTFNTDLESSTTLSESKFRQGLDASLFDISDKDEEGGANKKQSS